ncbi:MAG TPA: hypothetical protein PK657_12075, partial [Legionella sp.]|nr:hypothetical protein [Legionella sp.]
PGSLGQAEGRRKKVSALLATLFLATLVLAALFLAAHFLTTLFLTTLVLAALLLKGPYVPRLVRGIQEFQS